MKITEKQAQILFQIAVDSVRMNIINKGDLVDYEYRVKLVEKILSQQDDEKFMEFKEAPKGGFMG